MSQSENGDERGYHYALPTQPRSRTAQLASVAGSPWQPVDLANSVHDFYAGDRTPGRPNGLEAEHGTCEAIYCAMVLLHEIIEVFTAPNDNGGFVRRFCRKVDSNELLSIISCIFYSCTFQEMV
jgi:hypothetical protein